MASHEQIRVIKDGLDHWKVWRKNNPDVIVDLSDAELEGVNIAGADLQCANLTNSDLRKADLAHVNFQNANLCGANLEGADLRGANLKNVDFYGAKLHGARLDDACLVGTNVDYKQFKDDEAGLRYTDLRGRRFGRANIGGINFTGAKLQNASFRHTSLQNANLSSAELENADFHYRNLQGVNFKLANLQAANLRGVENLRLDETFIRGARFSPRATDPWSILRGAYTGPKFTFQLLALIAFVLPYIVKTAYWSAMNRGQEYAQILTETLRQRALDQGLDDQVITSLGLSAERIASLTRCLSEVCVEKSAGQLLLGLDQAAFFWVLPISIIGYNVLRGGLTFLVAPMRDEEERSGYSPAWSGDKWWHGYRPLFFIHRVVKVLAYVAGGAFLFNAVHWLGQPIFVPA